MQNRFYLHNTKRFFSLLVLAYFIFPSIASHFVFEGKFYIYSETQPLGDLYSFGIGIFLLGWIRWCVPTGPLYRNKLVEQIGQSRIFFWLYLGFHLYMLLLAMYGMRLRMSGASREDLLSGVDTFLVPGMSYLLLSASVATVAARSHWRLVCLMAMCLVIDLIFNGKIFTFLAAAIFFFRLDLLDISDKLRKRIWKGVFIVAPGLLLVTGVMRMSLGGGSLEFDLISMLYTFASEFLGVQASVAWAVDFFNSGQATTFSTYAVDLMNSYIGEVGHGLALSPVGYFVGYFGQLGLVWMVLAMFLLAIYIRVANSLISWVVFLILALNFQHFMRHGFDIFMVKVLTQSAFFCIVVQIVLFGRAVRLFEEPRQLGAIKGGV